jgi:5-methylcytosine-specific restriction endonuclease McrA
MNATGECATCGGEYDCEHWERCFVCRHPEAVWPDLLEAAERAHSLSSRLHRDRRQSVVDAAERARLLVLAVERGLLPEKDSSPSRRMWEERGEGWPEARRRALERDGFECQQCGLTHEEHKQRDDLFPPNKGLHVHHIVPFRTFDDPEEANRVANLVCLCASCHREVEYSEEPIAV